MRTTKSLKLLIGLTIDEASYLLKTHKNFNDFYGKYKYYIREVCKDGANFIITADYIGLRVNVKTMGGKIIEVLGIY